MWLARNFDFASEAVPSLADLISRVGSDPDFPAGRRAGTLSSLRAFARWVEQDPVAIPFAKPVLLGLFERLSPVLLGVSEKRLQNARSDLKFVLDRYGLGARRRYLGPLTPEVRACWGLLEDKYEQCSLSRLMHYLSAKKINPADMSENVSAAFLAALEREGATKGARTAHQSAIRAWNKVRRKYPGWPQIELTKPKYGATWTRPWHEFPPSVKAAAMAFLARGVDPAAIFDDTAPAQPLKATTIRTQMGHFRCAASALVLDGIPPEQLVDLRSLCTPERFKRVLTQMIARRSGKVGGYLAGLAWTLVKAARYSGSLNPTEIEEVNRLFKKLSLKRSSERRTECDRDQQLLEQFEDERRVDLFLSLPTRTVTKIMTSGARSVQAALMVQRACLLELWLCAPLRISNLVRLRLDSHFFRLKLDGNDRVVIRISPEEVKNHEAVEYYLSDDAAGLLDLYVKMFRPLLIKGRSQWLWPGRGDNPKRDFTVAAQMERFIKKGAAIDFHPHLIRKIVVKFLLDADPGAIEVARRLLGHKNTSTTRLAYTQRQQRAAHERYLDALEARRLRALRPGILAEAV